MNRNHYKIAGILLVGCLISAYSVFFQGEDSSANVDQLKTIPAKTESAMTESQDRRKEPIGLQEDTAKTTSDDDTPPWPPGTEDRLYQAIAEHLSKYPITGIISVDCEENLCTVLLSTPDTDLVGTGVYSGMMDDLRASNLGIGGSSVGVVEYTPGVQVIRLRVDNIEWTEERLRKVR